MTQRAMQPEWDNWLERLYNLRRDKSGTHERPRKPVLLLSIIDLLDRGLLTENAVPLSDELVAREASAPSISGCTPDVIPFHHRPI